MQRRFLGITLGLGLAALSGARPAAAFPAEMEVRVPFRFHVAQKVMPAGRYVILNTSMATPGLLVIRSEDGRHSALVLARESDLPEGHWTKSQVVFDRYGNQRFLRAIRTGDERDALGTSRAEIKAAEAAARNAQPTARASAS